MESISPSPPSPKPESSNSKSLLKKNISSKSLKKLSSGQRTPTQKGQSSTRQRSSSSKSPIPQGRNALELQDNSDREGGDGIIVAARFRPLNSEEQGCPSCITVKDDKTVVLQVLEENGVVLRDHQFSFDHVFGPESTQEEVYAAIGRPLLLDLVQAYNCSMLAYGQTGSGKTHSMLGPPTPGGAGAGAGLLSRGPERGMVPRIADELFEAVAAAGAHLEFTVRVSFVELYLEAIGDLLAVNRPTGPEGEGWQRPAVRVREDAERGVYLQGALEYYVGNRDEMVVLIERGSAHRAVAATEMNQDSGRSHAVFVVRVEQKDLNTGAKRSGCMYLVDLAGSELVAKSKAEGQTLKEARMINKSLSALGNVIKALTEGRDHVPYRDSKLTRLLQDALGGNSKTALLVAAPAAGAHAAETLGTLRFGARAKTVVNKPRVNQELTPAQCRAQLAAARAREAEARALVREMFAELGQLKAQFLAQRRERERGPPPPPPPAAAAAAPPAHLEPLREMVAAYSRRAHGAKEGEGGGGGGGRGGEGGGGGGGPPSLPASPRAAQASIYSRLQEILDTKVEQCMRAEERLENTKDQLQAVESELEESKANNTLCLNRIKKMKMSLREANQREKLLQNEKIELQMKVDKLERDLEDEKIKNITSATFSDQGDDASVSEVSTAPDTWERPEGGAAAAAAAAPSPPPAPSPSTPARKPAATARPRPFSSPAMPLPPAAAAAGGGGGGGGGGAEGEGEGEVGGGGAGGDGGGGDSGGEESGGSGGAGARGPGVGGPPERAAAGAPSWEWASGGLGEGDAADLRRDLAQLMAQHMALRKEHEAEKEANKDFIDKMNEPCSVFECPHKKLFAEVSISHRKLTKEYELSTTKYNQRKKQLMMLTHKTSRMERLMKRKDNAVKTMESTVAEVQKEFRSAIEENQAEEARLHEELESYRAWHAWAEGGGGGGGAAAALLGGGGDGGGGSLDGSSRGGGRGGGRAPSPPPPFPRGNGRPGDPRPPAGAGGIMSRLAKLGSSARSLGGSSGGGGGGERSARLFSSATDRSAGSGRSGRSASGGEGSPRRRRPRAPGTGPGLLTSTTVAAPGGGGGGGRPPTGLGERGSSWAARVSGLWAGRVVKPLRGGGPAEWAASLSAASSSRASNSTCEGSEGGSEDRGSLLYAAGGGGSGRGGAAAAAGGGGGGAGAGCSTPRRALQDFYGIGSEKKEGGGDDRSSGGSISSQNGNSTASGGDDSGGDGGSDPTSSRQHKDSKG